MPIFEDYHRTIIGYHGTRESTAREIVQLERPFKRSENDDDWLGNGIYFWEYAPQQAWNWARRRYRGEDIAVLGCMLRLGNCFDLLDPENARRLQRYHGRFLRDLNAAGRTPPRNVRARKRLDCAIFEYANAVFAAEEAEELDSVRAVYVPTSGKQRLWPQSWLYHETHVQLCIRNPRCILGTWLVRPREA
jgi:hypothetical protein